MIDETRLEHLAQQLGTRAAERLDVQATAHKVVERLREQPVVRRTVWVQQTWLRIAAALVIVLSGGLVLRQQLTPGANRSAVAHATHYVADDLGDLSTDQLRDVLTSFDDIITTGSIAVPESTTDLRQLDPQQLRAVLRSLEG